MLWLNNGQIQHMLETTFNDILDKHIRGLPIVNPALSVQAVGFNSYNKDWLGILITPWFMNLLLLPEPTSHWRDQLPGTTIEKQFPYGLFEFTLANEQQWGSYAFCSLFSPMFQFENQTAAFTAAQAALQGLLTPAAPRAVSRRDLLRGAIGK